MLKRAVGNIEMIMSFLLFIGFLFVSLYFFTPGGGNNRLVDSSLDYALREIVQNTSIDLLTYSIKINDVAIGIGGNPQVITIEFPPEVMSIPDNYNVTAETYDGKKVQVNRDSIDKSKIYLSWAGNKFVLIRFAEDFSSDSPLPTAAPLNTDYYTIASSSSRKIISEKKMLGLNNSYYSDYSSLKNSLNIPNQVDIGFNLKYDDGTMINAGRYIPNGLNVYSTLVHRETTLQKTNSLNYGDLSVQIW